MGNKLFDYINQIKHEKFVQNVKEYIYIKKKKKNQSQNQNGGDTMAHDPKDVCSPSGHELPLLKSNRPNSISKYALRDEDCL